MLILAAFLAVAAQSPSPAPDPIARAIEVLVAEVEEDRQPDRRLEAMATNGCETLVTAAGRTWTIDWRRAQRVVLEDTFVFVDAPPVRLAIVGDAGSPEQAARLVALSEAMQGAAARCGRPDAAPGSPEE